MSTHLLALYVAAVFLAMIAPGPDIMFVLATGMRGGARAGLLATLGVVSSEIVQITAVAAGLSALFAEAPVAQDPSASRRHRRLLSGQFC